MTDLVEDAGRTLCNPNAPKIVEKNRRKKEATNEAHDPMSLEIQHFFAMNYQKYTTLRKKYALSIALKKIIKDNIDGYYSWFRLFIVGSSVNGFGTDNSDLDLCVEVPSHYDLDQYFDIPSIDQNQLEANQREEWLTVLGLIKRGLLSSGECSAVTLIHAKVPILNFEHPATGIKVDVNCNNSFSIRNSRLLNYYSQMDDRVQPLVMAVKFWAQKKGINNPRHQTLSSYSLVLMVIHYLQFGVRPAILPVLQNGGPLAFRRKQRRKRLPYKAGRQFETTFNSESLSKLFIGFLNYYSNFDFNERVISVRRGTTISLNNVLLMHRNRDSYAGHYLYVEEPFNGSNTAVAVYDNAMFQRIRTAFQTSYNTIVLTKSFNLLVENNENPIMAPTLCKITTLSERDAEEDGSNMVGCEKSLHLSIQNQELPQTFAELCERRSLLERDAEEDSNNMVGCEKSLHLSIQNIEVPPTSPTLCERTPLQQRYAEEDSNNMVGGEERLHLPIQNIQVPATSPALCERRGLSERDAEDDSNNMVSCEKNLHLSIQNIEVPSTSPTVCERRGLSERDAENDSNNMVGPEESLHLPIQNIEVLPTSPMLCERKALQERDAEEDSNNMVGGEENLQLKIQHLEVVARIPIIYKGKPLRELDAEEDSNNIVGCEKSFHL